MSETAGRRSVAPARWPTLLALFGAAAAAQVASLTRPLVNLYDEGIIVVGAQRVLAGDVPYRDFWGMYGPGQFYAVAALFKLFTAALWVEQLCDVAVRSAIAVMVYLWARRLEAGVWSFAAFLITLLLLAGTGFHGFPVFPALLCALLSAYLLLDEQQPRLVAAGVFAGLTALFRHDLGLYLVLAETLALALAGPGRLARMLLPLALGVALVTVPVAAFLLIKVPLADLAFNLFVVPATIYPKVRALPFPPLFDRFNLAVGRMTAAQFTESFSICFPLFVAPAALAFLWVTRNEAAHKGLRLGIALLALIVLAMYLKGVVRISALHVMQSLIPAILLAFVLLARPRLGALVPRLAAGVVLALSVAAVPGQTAFGVAADNLAALRALRQETGLRLGLPLLCAAPGGLARARCFLPRPEDLAMAAAIRERTAPSEPIYVGTARHDRIFINNIMLYFLAERPPATRWHELHPGIQTTAPIQRQMIAEFEARKLRVVVLNGEWDAVIEPNASALPSGVTLLDDYIRANFTEVARAGAASLWQRK